MGGKQVSAQFWFKTCGKLVLMKKPFLRVTKWLGDIPVEAECTSCRGEAKFRVASASHRPAREEYSTQLQRAFDQHLRTVHAPNSTESSEKQD
jgi:hypothetical protein